MSTTNEAIQWTSQLFNEFESAELLTQMEKHYPRVTAETALEAAQYIWYLHNNYQDMPSNELIEEWKVAIDGVAADTMGAALREIPFLTRKVGSEGAKEEQYAGKAAPSVKGLYGSIGNPEVWGVSDVVEGTSMAARNQPGASCVLAVTEPGGIMPTPPDTNYLVKLIAPPQARGIINLDNYRQEDLWELCRVVGIKPSQLTQITMDPNKPGREINRQYTRIAEQAGIRLVTISVGDFMPGVRAALDPDRFGLDPVILVGRGGFEEGVMAGAAARAVGGFMQAQKWNKDPEVFAANPVLSLNDLVPGSADRTLLSASFITDDGAWFGQPGVRRNQDDGYSVTTMVVTHQGLRFQTDTILID